MIRRLFLKNLPPLSLAGFFLNDKPGLALTAPPADRTYWVQTLTRLAKPVLEALANDRLRERMPVEARPGITDRPQYTHLEAVGRLLAGMGPWLVLTTDDEAELRKDYRSLVGKGLANAINPQARDASGWLTIGLSGHQPGLGETYISTGSLYLTTTALLPLGLPTTDPFWAAPPPTGRVARSGRARICPMTMP